LEEIEFLFDAITRVGHGEFQLTRRWRRTLLYIYNKRAMYIIKIDITIKK
jgi:hypothetical protein